MHPIDTFKNSQIFGISYTEAAMYRKAVLSEYIADFTARLANAFKIYEEETHQVWKEIFYEKTIIPHQNKLAIAQKELEQFKTWNPYKPTKTIDWAKASQYTCTDLLGTPVKQMGKEWLYHSPHRSDKKPSFSVSREKNLWHDWGSGEGGNVIDLFVLLHGGTKAEAAKTLCEM
jgi:hypothetical protein